jgi:hypothetical protein
MNAKQTAMFGMLALVLAVAAASTTAAVYATKTPNFDNRKECVNSFKEEGRDEDEAIALCKEMVEEGNNQPEE